MSDSKTSTDETQVDADSIMYRCPYCQDEFHHEAITRVHITRSTDDTHRTHNGLMPEHEIDVVDADTGEAVDTISRARQFRVDESDLEVDDFGDDMRDRDKHIVMTAVFNPFEDQYTDLEEKVNSVLEFHGFESVSYDKVRNTLQSHLEKRPDQPRSASSDREEESDHSPECNQTDATNTVQAPIDPAMTPDANPQTHDESDEPTVEDVEAKLADLEGYQPEVIRQFAKFPDKNKTTIAEDVGCSPSYPGKIEQNYGHLIEEYREALERQEAAGDEVDETTDESEETEESTESEAVESEDDTPSTPAQVRLNRISPRNREVIKGLARHPGVSNEAIAADLDVDETVVRRLRRKYDDLIQDLADEVVDDLDEEDDPDEVTDAPTTGREAKPMTAAPGDTPLELGSTDDDAEEEEPEEEEEITEEVVEMTEDVDGIPPEAVQNILNAVKMFKESAEVESEYAQSREAARVLGVTEEIEDMLESVLEQHDNDNNKSTTIRVDSDGLVGVSAD